MTYSQIIERILAIMDEATPIDGVLFDDDTTINPTASMIDATLSGAWRSFVFHSPLHYLPTNQVTARTITNLVVTVTKPADFIRLASFMVSTWSRPAIESFFETDPIYTMQRNPYTKGTPTRPVVIITPTTIEGYSALTANDTLIMKYVPSVDFTDQASDLIPQSVGDAFCYHVAGLVYSSFGNKLFEVMFAQRDALCK